jgi:hypothetical protein
MIDPTGVMMIEPIRPASDEPLVDYWTYMAAMVYELTTPSAGGYRGVHQCVCGAQSDNKDHILPDGRIANSLMVHYVAFHRNDVPDSELLGKIDKIFKTEFPEFDFNAFDADKARQRELIASIRR